MAKRPRKRRGLPSVLAISDRGPDDRVERRDGRLFLVDGNGSYAPVQVRDDEGMDPAGQEAYREWVGTLHNNARVRWHLGVVAGAPNSEECREFRLAVLSEREKALWHERYGNAMFAIPDDDDVSWDLEREIAWLKAKRKRRSDEKKEEVWP